MLDVDSENDPFELYDVLDRIKSVLETRRYEFINLSVGPALPIEDDDVHGWTSYFDEFLSGGTTLATIAVGAGIRTHLRNTIWPLSVRALLVHSAECPSDNHIEHGWGRIPHEIEDVLLCRDDTVRVLYQGELSLAKYRRARIPVPAKTMAGMVSIESHLLLHMPGRSAGSRQLHANGLDILFRPNEDDLGEDALHPGSDSFFQLRRLSPPSASFAMTR